MLLSNHPGRPTCPQRLLSRSAGVPPQAVTAADTSPETTRHIEGKSRLWTPCPRVLVGLDAVSRLGQLVLHQPVWGFRASGECPSSLWLVLREEGIPVSPLLLRLLPTLTFLFRLWSSSLSGCPLADKSLRTLMAAHTAELKYVRFHPSHPTPSNTLAAALLPAPFTTKWPPFSD